MGGGGKKNFARDFPITTIISKGPQNLSLANFPNTDFPTTTPPPRKILYPRLMPILILIRHTVYKRSYNYVCTDDGHKTRTMIEYYYSKHRQCDAIRLEQFEIDTFREAITSELTISS